MESAGKPDALQTLREVPSARPLRGSVWSAWSLLPLSHAVHGESAVELSELRWTWSAEFIPLPAEWRGPEGSGLKSALLNSTAVGVGGGPVYGEANRRILNCQIYFFVRTFRVTIGRLALLTTR